MSSSSRDKKLDVDELLIHFKKISTISHKYAINKPTSSYSPQQTQALETILTVKETTERQRRSTIDSWTAAAMNQALLVPTKKKSDDDDKMQQKSSKHMPTEENKPAQQNSGVDDIETGNTKVSCEDCKSNIEVSSSEQLTPTPTKKRRNNNARQYSTPIDDWVDSVMKEVAHMMPKEVITTETSRPTLDDSTKSQDTIYKSCESSIISALTASTITSSSSSSSRSSATEVIPSLSDIQRRHKALKDKMDKIKSNRQESSKRHFNQKTRVPPQAPSIQSTIEKLGQCKQAASSGIRTSFTSNSTSATEGLSVCSSSCIADDEINETTVNNLLWS